MDNKDFHSQQGVCKYLINMKDLLNTLLIIIAVIDHLGSISLYLEATKQFDKKSHCKFKFLGKPSGRTGRQLELKVII